MIKELQHPLNEVARFGFTSHGLAMTSKGLRYVGPAGFPLTSELLTSMTDTAANLPREDAGDTHLLRVPGIAPLDMLAPEIEAEAALGRVWQNYALVSGPNPALFGDSLAGGWVCIDGAGARWLIQPSGSPSPRYGRVAAGASLTLSFEARPYGYMGEAPAAPVMLSATLANIGQANPPDITAPNGASLDMRVASVSSTGRQVLIALYPAVNPNNLDPRDMPYGWLMLTVSGSGPTLSVALSVARTRTQALGAWTTSSSGGIAHFTMLPVLASADHAVVRDAGGSIISGSGTWQWAGYTKSGIDGANNLFDFTSGSSSVVNTVTGRLLLLVFDASDTIVEMSADYESTTGVVSAEPLISATGSVQASGPGSVVFGASPSITGSISIDVTLNESWSVLASLTIKRNGTPADTFVCQGSGQGVTTDSFFLGTDQPSGLVANALREILNRGTSNTPNNYNFETGVASIRSTIGPLRMSPGVPDELWARDIKITHDGAQIDSVTSNGYRRVSVAWSVQRALMSATMPSDLPYARHEFAPQRLCNQLIACRYELLPSANATASTSAKTRVLLTPAGVWANPRTSDDPLDRTHLTGSYHPITQQVHATFDWTTANRTNGCWI